MSMKIGANTTSIPNDTIKPGGISEKAKELAQMQGTAIDKIQKPNEQKIGSKLVTNVKNTAKQTDDLKSSAKPSAPQQIQPMPGAANSANTVYNYNKAGTKVPIQAAGSAIDIIAK